VLPYKLAILRVTVPRLYFPQVAHGYAFLEELLMVEQALVLFEWSQVRFVLLLDLPLYIHCLGGACLSQPRRRQEPTRTMEFQVGVERLLVEWLDLCLLRLWNMPVSHLLAPCNRIAWGL
jgi:hypothetical protein